MIEAGPVKFVGFFVTVAAHAAPAIASDATSATTTRVISLLDWFVRVLESWISQKLEEGNLNLANDKQSTVLHGDALAMKTENRQ